VRWTGSTGVSKGFLPGGCRKKEEAGQRARTIAKRGEGNLGEKRGGGEDAAGDVGSRLAVRMSTNATTVSAKKNRGARQERNGGRSLTRWEGKWGIAGRSNSGRTKFM